MTRDDSPNAAKDHPAMRKSIYFDLFVLFALGAIAIATRLLPHAPGFVAVTGAALFAGWYVRKTALAFVFPIGVLLLSDVAIGFYEPMIMAAVYLGAVLTMMVGRMAHRKPQFGRLTCFVLACSVLNFLLINLVVWAGSGWYDRSLAGLFQCYAAALPFFKYRLAGDACWTAVFFAPYIAATLAARWRSRAPRLALQQAATAT